MTVTRSFTIEDLPPYSIYIGTKRDIVVDVYHDSTIVLSVSLTEAEAATLVDRLCGALRELAAADVVTVGRG